MEHTHEYTFQQVYPSKDILIQACRCGKVIFTKVEDEVVEVGVRNVGGGGLGVTR